MRDPAEPIEALLIDTLIDAIAGALGLERSALSAHTDLAAANLDSLTLVTVLTDVELAFGVRFATDDLAEMLGARSVAELAAAVAPKIAPSERFSSNARDSGAARAAERTSNGDAHSKGGH